MRPYLPNVLMALSARLHCEITEFKRESDSDSPDPVRRRHLRDRGDAGGSLRAEEGTRP